MFNNVEPEYDEEGNITNQDDIDAGVYFDAGSPGDRPHRGDPGDRREHLSLTYSKPFADWEVALPPRPPGARRRAAGPRHRGPGGGQAGPRRRDHQRGRRGARRRSSKVWSTDFNYTDLPDDPGLYLSNGAYLMTELVADQFVTLEANPEYEGDRPASIETVTVRWNGDPMGQVQALQNGEVDLISPQATADVLDRRRGDGRRRGPDAATRARTSTSTCSSPTAARSTRPPTAATRTRPRPSARRSSR